MEIAFALAVIALGAKVAGDVWAKLKASANEPLTNTTPVPATPTPAEPATARPHGTAQMIRTPSPAATTTRTERRTPSWPRTE